MAEHTASLHWARGNGAFGREGYSRDHSLTFENGQQVLASAAPDYAGNPQALNPETLLVGSLSSCHMLTFLSLCTNRGYAVDCYDDHASGTLGKNAEGRMAITRIVLRPKVTFSGDKQPDAGELTTLHERAHVHCFIANSVITEVSVEPA